MKQFDAIISQYSHIHKDLDDYSEAILFFINSKYSVMSFNGSLNLKPGDTLLLLRDFITDIHCNDIYYTYDNKEFLIDSNTKLLTFLTPLNFINLRNKSETEQTITFKRWLINLPIIDEITSQTICDGNNIYYYGMIRENI